jgi:hypothetical protein
MYGRTDELAGFVDLNFADAWGWRVVKHHIYLGPIMGPWGAQEACAQSHSIHGALGVLNVMLCFYLVL